MEVIIFFLYLVAFVFGVLQIILFFKVWGMTNDVKRLVEYICDGQRMPVTVAPSTTASHATKPSVAHVTESPSGQPTAPAATPRNSKSQSDLANGNKVRRKADGVIMTVDTVDAKGHVFCKTGFMSCEMYNIEDLEIIG